MVRKGQPLYQTIRDHILQRISEGEWAPGVALPSEAQLAKAYRVGISTVRAAVSKLVSADVLICHQGKGTFVTAHNLENDIYRFFHVVQSDGQKPLPKSHLLSFEKCRADSKTADILQLPHMKPEVFRIRNLLLVSGQPQVASDISVPTDAIAGTVKSHHRGQPKYAVRPVSEPLWRDDLEDPREAMGQRFHLSRSPDSCVCPKASLCSPFTASATPSAGGPPNRQSLGTHRRLSLRVQHRYECRGAALTSGTRDQYGLGEWDDWGQQS